ncbi:MAG: aminotransferase class V-fold PLP-dependent enzyme, partial [Chloroflexota bacterium]
LLLADGAQSVPHISVNVGKLGCDFLAFSGHKMLGPMGIGVLYARAELLEQMDPFMGGGSMIQEVARESATWNDIPQKFEAGTPNVEGAVGLGAAIDYLQQLGMENIRQHELDITAHALETLSRIEGLNIYGPLDPAKRSGVISFTLDGVDAYDLAAFMDQEGIALRSGHHCCQPLMNWLNVPSTARASFYLYNNKEEVDLLGSWLNTARSVLSIL